MNILLVVVDCLRYDHVNTDLMPHLYRWGANHLWFDNYWTSSHCTDPSITHLLFGKHPDELGLYSMMFEEPSYSIPKMPGIFAIARQNGYMTGACTNIGRWYRWDVDRFVDTRGKERHTDADATIRMMLELPQPWIIFMHNADCHANYADSSYDAACTYVDNLLKPVLALAEAMEALIIVTADHGEGLGQKGPDGHCIDQHGYGLWDFITHVPLLIGYPGTHLARLRTLCSNGDVYNLMRRIIEEPRLELSNIGLLQGWAVQEAIFQAGATPDVVHRGVVWPDGRQFVRARRKDAEGDTFDRYYIGDFPEAEMLQIEQQLAAHCKSCGVDYGDIGGEEIILERLKGLGYFE